MPDVPHYVWTLPHPDRAPALALAAHLGIPEPFAALLATRGLTADTCAAFLQPAYSPLPDGRLFKNGEASIARLTQAIRDREQILIHGDYDVDGICGAVLYHRALTQLGGQVRAFLPSRFRDGYGVATRAIEQALGSDYRLLVTADTGSQAYEAVDLAVTGGMDVIVTDHHQIGTRALATPYFINPQQPDCPYPYKGLSGGGVALKMILAVAEELGTPLDPDTYLPFATLSTIADVCPLTGENRALVQRGLELLAKSHHPGLRALVQSLKRATPALTAKDCSHGLIPKLNAVGRLEDPKLARDLLLCEHPDKARALTQQLEGLNAQRKNIQQSVATEASRMAEQYLARHPESRVLVLSAPQWHFGVVGIVAAKLVDRFQLPAICLTQHQEQLRKGPEGAPWHYTGSGRAPRGIALLSALESCRAMLDHFGGHEQAVGLALVTGQIEPFREALNAALIDAQADHAPIPLIIDAWLDPAHIDRPLLKDLARLEPCGAGNPEPTFAIGPLQVEAIKPLGDGSHRALTLTDARNTTWRAVHFQCPTEAPRKGDLVCIIGTPVLSTWNGTTKLEIQVKDLGLWAEVAALAPLAAISATG